MCFLIKWVCVQRAKRYDCNLYELRFDKYYCINMTFGVSLIPNATVITSAVRHWMFSGFLHITVNVLPLK